MAESRIRKVLFCTGSIGGGATDCHHCLGHGTRDHASNRASTAPLTFRPTSAAYASLTMTDRGRMALVQFLDRLVPRTRAPASKELLRSVRYAAFCSMGTSW